MPRYENYGLPYHRSHREDGQPLKPGEPVRLAFTFLPASHIFKAGHRIRISVAGSDYRERERTPVSPAPIVTILNAPFNPSYISLPLINLKNVRDYKKRED
jgi:predicted acyl esterase